MKITDDARIRTLLFHYVGEHTHDIYKANKSDQEPDDSNRFKTAKTDLAKYSLERNLLRNTS